MKKKTTMQDIADKLGITKVSVSKALGDKPGVSDSLRREIIQTAGEMGYVVSQPTEDKKSFAFVVPKRFFLETDKFYSAIFYYLSNLCMEKGFSFAPVVLSLKSEDTAEDYSFYEGFDGIYIAGELSDNYINMLQRTAKPLVAIDFYKTYFDASYVLIDNFYIGYHATCHLIEQGHRKIGFVGNISQTSSINDRYYGYLKALETNGLPFKNEWVFPNNNPQTGLYNMDVSFPSPLPTAFVCHCDMAAYFLSNSLKNIGKSVPQDISLISFDNTELSEAFGLTSMDINKKEIAETAFYVMDKIIHKEKHRNRYYVSTRLINRESVRALM
ncbi:MAG: LacI family DNA-binding transcriptional regulator [Defluviitaleaceae bacterium]|nr:LacI family DNA-binding transcriptional regulator [Defluviitaleaceae bacterium]